MNTGNQITSTTHPNFIVKYAREGRAENELTGAWHLNTSYVVVQRIFGGREKIAHKFVKHDAEVMINIYERVPNLYTHMLYSYLFQIIFRPHLAMIKVREVPKCS